MIILEPLENAIVSLEESIESFKGLNPSSGEQLKQYKFVRDSVIRRFEYTYELSWKFLKRFLKEEAEIEEIMIKNLFRQAARLGLIEEAENWFEYHKQRNLTSHTYVEEIAEQTIKIASAFLVDAKSLLRELKENLNGN
ncbi:MAG: HI0074 family nucleotidyltransferase substrate-binding subunit [Candidatus Caenarcaniphilales bacterium]|nr:HI0074 family nucleotidyltransferase substrate-binding subunit [Candidatus Caenarcaniphilales bacterium]